VVDGSLIGVCHSSGNIRDGVRRSGLGHGPLLTGIEARCGREEESLAELFGVHGREFLFVKPGAPIGEFENISKSSEELLVGLQMWGKVLLMFGEESDTLLYCFVMSLGRFAEFCEGDGFPTVYLALLRVTLIL